MFESMFVGGRAYCHYPNTVCDFSLPRYRTPFPTQARNPEFRKDVPDWFVNLLQLPVFWNMTEGCQYPHFLFTEVDNEGSSISSIGHAVEAIEEWKAKLVNENWWVVSLG